MKYDTIPSLKRGALDKIVKRDRIYNMEIISLSDDETAV